MRQWRKTAQVQNASFKINICLGIKYEYVVVTHTLHKIILIAHFYHILKSD